MYAVYEQSTKYAVIGGDVGYRQVDMKASYAVEGELKVVEKREIEPWMNRSEIFFFDVFTLLSTTSLFKILL